MSAPSYLCVTCEALTKTIDDLRAEIAGARDLQVVQALQKEVKESRQAIADMTEQRDRAERERGELMQQVASLRDHGDDPRGW